jgi:hypothetical protein
LHQVPHAFQDILGSEATPTLCYTIEAFSMFIQRWEELAASYDQWETLIRPGLDKLDTYSMDLDRVPVYTLAMGNVLFFLHKTIILFSHHFIALDPLVKLGAYVSDRERYRDARQLLINAVNYPIKFPYPGRLIILFEGSITPIQHCSNSCSAHSYCAACSAQTSICKGHFRYEPRSRSSSSAKQISRG